MEASLSKENKLKRLWIFGGVISFLFVVVTIMELSFNFFSRIHPILGNVAIGGLGGIGMCIFFVILYSSSGSNAVNIFYHLMDERRVIFIVLLLGILFYIDNIYGYWTAGGVLFPMVIIVYISFDVIVIYFPRRLALGLMMLNFVILSWNIYRYTFVITDCKQNMLAWGVFGENISYCTIKRIIYQSVFSLMVSAAIAILAGRTDNLFFCNANIYRSTGTIDRSSVNEKYVESMKMERGRGMIAGLGSC